MWVLMMVIQYESFIGAGEIYIKDVPGVLPRAHIYGVCVKCIKITGDVQGRVQDLGLKMEMVFVQRSASLLSMKL